MGRILAIDYGEMRCGLATTDPLKLIVSGLKGVPTKELRSWLENYCASESVDLLVIGLPVHRDGSFTHLKSGIDELAAWAGSALPGIDVVFADERNTSNLAVEALVKAGVPRKRRQQKMRIDEVSAVIILQRYLGHF
ncbi:MAG: Holliday junction resolvase RuvX [Saprospiraceae bacterium]|nr:Holliday junction resolvase RuvX [Saprospiraceae bacterium]